MQAEVYRYLCSRRSLHSSPGAEEYFILGIVAEVNDH